MKKTKATILLFLFISINSYSQNFHSNLEKEVFHKFKTDSINYPFFESLFAIDSLVNKEDVELYRQKIEQTLSTIPPRESKDSKEKKRIKFIYNTFHNQYFQKYEEVAYFQDMFKSGIYNCVTATALYVYVFDKLKIPYHVKEAPSHVYLIAYPNSHKIYLETTAPGKYGFIVPKESEIKKIVDELVDVKLVSKSEFQSKGHNQVYEDYFYGKEFVQKSALIGMQYFNRGIEDYENKKYLSSQNNISKSLAYHKRPMSEILYKELLSMNIATLDFDNENDFNVLLDYFSQLKFKEDFDTSDVQYLINKITQNDNNDLSFIESVTSKLNKINNIELKHLCIEILYEFIARHEVDRLNYNNAMKYCFLVLELNENSKIAKQIIIHSIHQKTITGNSNENGLIELEKLYAQNIFLENDKRIETARAVLLGQLTVEQFNQRNDKKAMKFLNRLEVLLASKNEYIIVNSQFYPMVFLSAGRYYYGMENYEQALKIFKTGLKYAPENAELKKMQEWTIEDLN